MMIFRFLGWTAFDGDEVPDSTLINECNILYYNKITDHGPTNPAPRLAPCRCKEELSATSAGVAYLASDIHCAAMKPRASSFSDDAMRGSLPTHLQVWIVA